MGQVESSRRTGEPVDVPDDKQIILTEKELTGLPMKLTEDNQIEYLNLAKNRIQKLPKHMPCLLTLTLSDNAMSSIPKNVMRRIIEYPVLQALDLSYNRLSALQSGLEQVKTLLRLNLFGNRLKTLDLSKNHLNNVDLGRNFLRRIPDCGDSLVMLALDFNLIEELDAEMPTLKTLCLSRNRLTSLKPGLVFQSLSVLDISRNDVSELPDLRVYTPVLCHLDASSNKIGRLPRFPSSIVEILLQKNQISEIPTGFADGLDSLKTMNLSDNLIENIPNIDGLSAILTITMNNNRIVGSEEIHIAKFKRLYLAGNRLEAVPRVKNSQMTDYFLQRNCISQLIWSDFTAVVNRIDLCDNLIETIPDEFFGSLPRLEYLILSRNKIRTLPESIAKSKLILLNVSDNLLETFPPRFPETLEQLYVVGCGLEAIPDYLSENGELIELIAGNNKLRSIPFIASLEVVNLSNNAIIQFPELPQSIRQLDLSFNHISTLPDSISFPSLTMLDLSYNVIDRLPSEMNLPRMSWLAIAHNPIQDSMDLGRFPAIRSVFATDTWIRFGDEFPPKMRILTSRKCQIRSLVGELMNVGEKVAIAQTQGTRELHEDVPLLRNDKDLYAVFSTHTGGKTARAIVGELVRQCEGRIDEKAIVGCFERVIKSSNFNKCMDLSSFAIVEKKGQELLAGQNGAMTILVLNTDGTLIRVKEKNRATRKDDPTDGLEQNEGTFMVFGIEISPRISRYTLTPEAKWLIIMSNVVYDTLPSDCITRVGLAAPSAASFAHDLRSHVFGQKVTDNISVVVADLRSK